MATVVTKVVKYTGGDYTTLTAALAALPASLVTADQQWDIKIDESASGNVEWVTSTGYTFPAVTADATRFVRILPNTGKGFRDHASKLSNALRYNASNGIGVRVTGAFETMFSTIPDYTVFEGLQLKADHVFVATPLLPAGARYQSCIVQRVDADDRTSYNNESPTCRLGYAGSRAIDSVFVGNCGVSKYDGGTGARYVQKCTFIRQGDSGAAADSYAVASDSATDLVVTNTAFLGFTNFGHAGGGQIDTSSNYNATNNSAPTNFGANSIAGLTAASQVTSLTNGSIDARAVDTGSLDGAGTRDTSYNGDLDIVGSARSTSAPTIGAWEVAGGAPPASAGGRMLLMGVGG